MKIQSTGSSEKSKAAAFEQVRTNTPEYRVIINPAIGAGFHERRFNASTQEEANLKAKKLAQEIFEQECKIQFVE